MTSADPTFEGVYGTYSITAADRQEVRSYRIALLITGQPGCRSAAVVADR